MGLDNFKNILRKELERIDSLKVAKRNEKTIKGFTQDLCPRAIIKDKNYILFNSNDYLGLRFNKAVIAAEERGTNLYGVGPGAVRFISGTTEAHKNLEKSIADFHGREDAIIFSSTFAANLSVLHALIKGQSAESLVSVNTLVISDELNHRSIIEGIRVANLPTEQKKVFKHLNYEDLERILIDNKGRFNRVVLVTDGIFSMLGEAQNLKKIKTLAEKYDSEYEEGIIIVMDDAHGVGCFGATGRGCEEEFGARADVLIGTFGKAFGADGGYVVGDKLLIDYLRESAASYIYSSPISGGNASAGVEAIHIMHGPEGKNILNKLNRNISLFKQKATQAGLVLAADSSHPIQPILIGDSEKTKKLIELLFHDGFLVTNINYPIVPKGRDEIRVQISALHGEKEIVDFVNACVKHAKELEIIN